MEYKYLGAIGGVGGVQTAIYRSFDDYEVGKAYLETMNHRVVIKSSGPAAEKGALMPENAIESIKDLDRMMLQREFGDAASTVVIEERLLGDEISITFLSDGYSLEISPAGQDAQRI